MSLINLSVPSMHRAIFSGADPGNYWGHNNFVEAFESRAEPEKILVCMGLRIIIQTFVYSDSTMRQYKNYTILTIKYTCTIKEIIE